MYSKVYVEITNICNMHCSFCHGHSRKARRMTEEEFACILEKLKGHTNFIYYHLMGEPLTHPQLPEFLRMAGRQGYKSVITTNGTLLPKRGDALLAAGLHKVNISLHSFEEGDPEDHIAYLRGIADFTRKAAENGTIVTFRLWNQGCDDGKNDFALAKLQAFLPGDWKPNTRGVRVRDKVFLEMADRFAWPDKDADIQGEKFYCYGLKAQIGILVDGTVVPCCMDSDGIIDLGNVYEENLDTILGGKRAQDILDGFQCGKASEDLCRRCGFAQKFVR